MNHKNALIVLAVVVLAAVPISLLLSETSDAQVSVDNSAIWGQGFTDRSDGTLFITLNRDESNDQTMTITITENNRQVASSTVVVPASETGTMVPFVAQMNFRLGAGTHDLTITLTAENPVFVLPSGPSTTYTTSAIVDSTQSVLSKPSTYAALAIVAILIVIGVYLYIRNAPTKKPETTFTELERQKRESKEEAEEAPKASATERRRYNKDTGGDKPKEAAKLAARQKETAKPAEPPEEKKKKSAAPPDEKKAASPFTDLEKQKQEKQEKKETPPANKKETAAPSKKESSSEEPKKIKYVSSRRK